MFEAFFKYSRVVFEQGEWFLRNRPSFILLLASGVLFLAALFFAYRRTTAPLRPAWQSAFMGMRLIVLAVIGFCLFEPVLSISTVVPQKSSVLVFVDDSRSMAITDAAGRARRIDQVKNWLAETPSSVVSRLQKDFRVETFRFSAGIEPWSQQELRAEGASTDIGRVLDFAARKARQGAVSGVVLVTDGAQSAGADPLQVSHELTAAKVPVFTVGVGSKIATDVQVAKVEATPSVLENSMVEVNALIQSRGLEGKSVEVELREGQTVVQRQTIALDNRSMRLSMQFSPATRGHAKYTLAIPPLPGEMVAENNEKSFLINSQDRRARVLYVAQLTPWEFKFMSRSLSGDKSLLLTSLLETGPEKFLRLGLRSANELAAGFPHDRSELFGYEAVVFGSVPASFFTNEQLQLVHDFVSERGGGFLMLGGRRAFSQGGYQATPIAELLPVTLLPIAETDGRGAIPQLQEEFRFTPAPENLTHPLLQLDPEPAANRLAWEQLPLLQGYNPLGAAKPGATVLGVHPLHRQESPKIVLAMQRYGRGRTAALATSTTWRWQMHLDSRDQTHERFWRQLIRWLSLQAPEPVMVELDRENYAVGEPIVMHLDVRDSAFVSYQNANVSVKITGPDGTAQSLVGSPNLGADHQRTTAQYLASMHAAQEGLYRVEVLAHDRQGHFLGRAESAFFVEPSQVELANADLQQAMLQRLAEVTGGRYFPLSQSQDLASAIAVSRSSFSKLTEHDLWDAPIFFLAIALLLGGEWYLRRARGLS